jgi:hypothetical protein
VAVDGGDVLNPGAAAETVNENDVDAVEVTTHEVVDTEHVLPAGLETTE